MDDILSYIKVFQYTVGFVFDSGDSLSAFSRVSFMDEHGSTKRTFVPGCEEDISIPVSGYLGEPIQRFVSGSGFITIEFQNGRMISVHRVGEEAEVALLMRGGKAEVIV